MKTPCLDCKRRKVNCHSKCKDYQSFKKIIEKRNKKMRSESEYKDYRAEIFGRKRKWEL